MAADTEKPARTAPLEKLAMRKATAERLLSDFQHKVDSAPPEKHFDENHPLHPGRIHSTREKINEILATLRLKANALEDSDS